MAKKAGLWIGIVFVIIGVLGFLNNPIVGDNGYFMTNTLHDLVHLVSGLIFIFVGVKSPQSMGITFKIFGIVYLLVTILGFMAMDGGMGTVLGLHVNGPDNILHVVLAILLLVLGFKVGKGRGMSSSMPMGGMPQ